MTNQKWYIGSWNVILFALLSNISFSMSDLRDRETFADDTKRYFEITFADDMALLKKARK